MRRPVAALAALLVAAAPLAAPPAAAAPDPERLAIAAAERLVKRHPERVKRAPGDRMVRKRVIVGGGGLRYVPYERTHKGLPVRGGDFVVVTGSQGQVLSTSVNQRRPLEVTTRPRVRPESAAATARDELKAADRTSRPRLVVLARGKGTLAYETVVTGTREGRPSRLHVLVDAGNGEVVGRWDAVREGTGRGHYLGDVSFATMRSSTTYGMADPNRPGVRCAHENGDTMTDPDDHWGTGAGTDLASACVDAMYTAQRGWDMLAQWLGRTGYDGYGRGFPMAVGFDVVNAYYTGSWTRFGHNEAGDRQATAPDVVAHELGHGVFEWTPGGSGGATPEKNALNESTADILGTLTEWFIDSPYDRPDYLMAEEVDFLGEGPVRVMYRPSDRGDPNCFSSIVRNMEPHAAAGVQNHWFYLLANGSLPNDPANGRPNSPTCDGRVVSGVGLPKAGRIYMETLNRKVTDWTHEQARRASLEAAKQLFPGSCAEFRAVYDAWNAVSVPRHPEEPTCT